MANNSTLNTDQILAILSQSKAATAVYTSDEIIIQSANEAMLRFWGKDKTIIGKPLEEGVPELKGQPFKTMLQNVLKTGVTDSGIIPATTMIDGKLQTFYYDYEYTAIKNQSGTTYAILHTASDVTEKESNRIALEKAKLQDEMQAKALAESEASLRLVIAQAQVAIAIFRGPEYRVEIVNDKALELWDAKKMK